MIYREVSRDEFQRMIRDRAASLQELRAARNAATGNAAPIIDAEFTVVNERRIEHKEE